MSLDTVIDDRERSLMGFATLAMICLASVVGPLLAWARHDQVSYPRQSLLRAMRGLLALPCDS
jgi:hypothetical protein